MLDQLSGGRLELGIGRGVTPYELNYFGVDPAHTREIFDETLAVLVAGLTNNRLSFEGRHLSLSRRADGIAAFPAALPAAVVPDEQPGQRPLCRPARL